MAEKHLPRLNDTRSPPEMVRAIISARNLDNIQRHYRDPRANEYQENYYRMRAGCLA